jgi:hypothetical protein
MKINKLNNIFTTFAKSSAGKKFYKNILTPSKDTFLNNHLPIIESAVVTAFYCTSTAVQKDIPPENRKSIQIQNVLSFIISAATAMPLNKMATKFGEQVIKSLKPEVIPDVHKCIDGIKVGLPMVTTLLISRFAVAVGLVPLSTVIRNKIDKTAQMSKKSELNKTNKLNKAV